MTKISLLASSPSLASSDKIPNMSANCILRLTQTSTKSQGAAESHTPALDTPVSDTLLLDTPSLDTSALQTGRLLCLRSDERADVSVGVGSFHWDVEHFPRQHFTSTIKATYVGVFRSR